MIIVIVRSVKGSFPGKTKEKLLQKGYKVRSRSIIILTIRTLSGTTCDEFYLISIFSQYSSLPIPVPSSLRVTIMIIGK